MSNQFCFICFKVGYMDQYLLSEWGYGSKAICGKCAKTLNKAGWLSLSIITRFKRLRLRRKIKQLLEKNEALREKRLPDIEGIIGRRNKVLDLSDP